MPELKPRAALAEQANAQLKAGLHGFLWVPGDRLSASDIGARLGVNRTSVREALSRLRNEGFLDVQSKAGRFGLDFTRGDRIAATCAGHAKILRAVLQRKPDAAKLLRKSHVAQGKLERRKITLHALLQARERSRVERTGLDLVG